MTDEITPARLRELADNAFDTEFRVLQAALRAAASTIEIERETNGATALLLQQARATLAAREALLKRGGDALAEVSEDGTRCLDAIESRRQAREFSHWQGFAMSDYAHSIDTARALAAEIAAALGGKTDE